MGPVIVGGLASLFALAIVGYLGWRQMTAVTHDKVSFCPVTGPVAVHAILIDNSDPLTPIQEQRISQRVEEIAQDAPVDERVDLFLLAGGGAVATPMVSFCRPPSDGNPLTQNPERIRRAFVTKYLDPLREAMLRAEQSREQPASPIMESIKAVCVGAFGDLRDGTPTKLTVVSDMIENSSFLNQYKPYDVDAFMRSPKLLGVLANCYRADVDILYLTRPRDARLQTRTHERFWEIFLDRMNARLMSMERI